VSEGGNPLTLTLKAMPMKPSTEVTGQVRWQSGDYR